MKLQQTTDIKMNKMEKVLTGYAREKNISFCYEGQELTPNESFSANGFLTLFMAEGKEFYEKVANGLYTHRELMDVLSPNKVGKPKKMSPAEYEAEENYLRSQSIAYRFPVVFVQKDNTYVGVTPFVDKTKKFPMLTMATFVLAGLDEYVKRYEKDKSLLIDGMIPIEPLFEKVQMDIKNKKVKIYPSSMLAGFESGTGMPVVPTPSPAQELREVQQVIEQQKGLQNEALDDEKNFADSIDSLFS